MTTMPMDPMTCDGFADALMAYLEHDAPHAVRAAVEGHAAACASCAALLDDIRRIEHQAAHLPVLEPSRDLWTGIAARIETPVVDLAPRTPARSARPWIRPALVAAGLVLVSVATTYTAMRRGDAPAAPQLANAPVARPAAPAIASTEPLVVE
ncbi:MAG TPA: zf-HC2 domain-containing protein, partial [Gemmatimonadaceae bacterium]|nr:zf-HC2 domain-containing protein [Gemmatimonadaceae bacterium]